MHIRVNLWKSEEYSYPAAFGFQPNLALYLHGDQTERPGMLVVPGGAYCMVSPTEAEIVAMTFYRMGYQAFVLTYTTNPALQCPLYTQPMADLSRAIRMIRSRAKTYRVRENQLAVCGFSAGGHLCACVGVHYGDIQDPDAQYRGISNRPDAMILGYSLISAERLGESECREALLGPHPSEEVLRYFSPDAFVRPGGTPCFLWHCHGDALVPDTESVCMAEACRNQNVPFALHLFTQGSHGMSVATKDWERGAFGPYYTYEQARLTAKQVACGAIPCPELAKNLRRFLPETGDGGRPRRDADASREVAQWPQMAAAWLDDLFA